MLREDERSALLYEHPEQFKSPYVELDGKEATAILSSPEILEPSDDAALIKDLLRIEFIRRVESESGIGYEVTAQGHQFMADYESQPWAVDRSSNLTINSTLTALRAASLPFTAQEANTLLHTLNGSEKKPEQEKHLKRVSILIPTRNEAGNIENLLKKIHSSFPKMSDIIVIDGGSTDETASIATKLGAKVIIQQGAGKGVAMRQAFANDHAGDIIVMIDSDGSNRPEEIPRLVEAVVNGADIAKGSRFLKGGGTTDLTRIRRIGNKLFISMVNLFWGGHYTDLCYGLIAYKKEALERLIPLLESKYFQIETEICIKALKLGLKVVEVPSNELQRRHGTSKLRGIHDSMSIAKTILTELFSTS